MDWVIDYSSKKVFQLVCQKCTSNLDLFKVDGVYYCQDCINEHNEALEEKLATYRAKLFEIQAASKKTLSKLSESLGYDRGTLNNFYSRRTTGSQGLLTNIDLLAKKYLEEKC